MAGNSMSNGFSQHQAAVGEGISPRVEPRPSQTEDTETREEVISVLRQFGLTTIADRLGYLHSLAAEDPEETPIALESLRRLSKFVVGQRRLPDPEIAVSPDGFAQAEWLIADSGILAMEFMPSDTIRFAAVSGPTNGETQQVRVSGVLPTSDALDAVRVFTDQLAERC